MQRSESRLAGATQLNSFACPGLPGATMQTVPSAPEPGHHCHTQGDTTTPSLCHSHLCHNKMLVEALLTGPLPCYPACMMQLYTGGPALTCSHLPKATPHLLSGHDHDIASLQCSTSCSSAHEPLPVPLQLCPHLLPWVFSAHHMAQWAHRTQCSVRSQPRVPQPSPVWRLTHCNSHSLSPHSTEEGRRHYAHAYP